MSTKDQQISKENFQRTTHPDAQWFGEAGFGLFIHWGISSAHGGLTCPGVWWTRNPGIRETGM